MTQITDNTTNDTVEEEIDSWQLFGSILRENDRKLFEQMLNECREYKNAIATRGDLFTVESLMMSLIFIQQKMIKELMKESGFPKSQTSIDEN
jgi:hypothetical protein